MIRIPLQPHVRFGDGLLPCLVTRKQHRRKRGRNRLPQNRVEKSPAKSNSQNDFLIRRPPPVTAIHHPQKIRLDPTHAAITKLAAKAAVASGEKANGWA